MSISVVINTYNEPEKLTGCLESVKDFADEIVIVDMGSNDATLEIAEKYKAKVYPHELLPYVEPARNFGISKATGKWILVLDPDERISKTLAEKLREIVKDDDADVVQIPRKNIIFGKWLRHTNCWPDYHARFFKKGKVTWTDTIHAALEVRGTMKAEGKVFKLDPLESLAIEHLNYDNINQFLERQNRYSEMSVKNRFEKGEKFSWKNFFWKPKRVFLQRYIRHAGFLDGFCGFAFSYLVAYSQLAEEVKLWEKEKAK
ncbi:MAG: glycosyltransferase family 2 protein [bacterium]|nr:glycosyltransferase family 2 protein [bacterium]